MIQAQDRSLLEKSRKTYDSLAKIIQNDPAFFSDLKKVIEIRDSRLEKFKLAIKQPYDSLGKIVTTPYIKYTDKGRVKAVEEGDPSYILETLLLYKSLLEDERNYQYEITQYLKRLKLNKKTLTKQDFVGTYLKIKSSSYSINNGDTIPDIDSTLLVLRQDSTFSYSWSPLFKSNNSKQIKTNGKWSFKGNKIFLNSEYQQDEWRFFEDYKVEYGDSITKIYVQTYDSLISIIKFNRIGILKDSLKKSAMLLPDKVNKNTCSVNFKVPNVDKIVFFSDFFLMPIIKPKKKNSNHFLLQYNLSTNRDYQYMKNLEWDFKGDELSIVVKWGERMKLKKIK